MHKLFRYYLCSCHKNCYDTPKFLLSVLQFHTFRKPPSTNSKLDYVFSEVDALNSSISTKPLAKNVSKINEVSGQREYIQVEKSMVKISHPWPEWVDLMGLLLKRSYFENGNPFINGELGNKEKNWIRTACLNFGRDHFGLLRFLSRKDIRVIVGFGCPSIDRKVVNSGKRLRAHVGVDEGNVCSSCKLRGDCERAYVKAREVEVGRTLDVVRILLTYGLDSISIENKPVQNKMVTDSIRILLKELVESSSQPYDSDFPDSRSSNTGASLQNHSNVLVKQGDWLCPKCNFLNFARNIRCLRCDGFSQERLKQLHEDQYDLPLKKGDWICQKCNFLNFAKNTSCLQCKEKPTNRRINPGEWECESCNYVNFRRNMVCLKCDHRRLKALNAPNNSSTQLKPDGAAYPNQRRTRFVHDEIEAIDDKSMGPDRTNQRRHVDMWRFVQEDREDDSNEDSRFLDFPIMGGKSSLSQDAEKRERWKVEMLEKNKTGTRMNESDEEPRSPGTQRTCKYLQVQTTDDDEDMAEWFGQAKEMECQG